MHVMIEHVIHIPEYQEVLKIRKKSKNSSGGKYINIQHAISVYVARSTSISAGGTDV
jgi:hypothetical protein